MFKEIRVLKEENDTIIINCRDFLEIQFISEKDYPFINVRIHKRDQLEDTQREWLIEYNTVDHDSSFDRENNLWYFRPSTELDLQDYVGIIEGKTADGHQEEIRRFHMTVRHR